MNRETIEWKATKPRKIFMYERQGILNRIGKILIDHQMLNTA